ncbi:basic salivary proline-rich protein 4-like [Oncorhynchus tshawytscha]|uniref:basic salivary proline-rich protein 4-like n=1 Tax=Oncorhynchus tshawytscha TaxID=74940 RepID=UPI001C3C3CAC|nr:basic salivary proline-rich protein 4-like [Oncorhynchus tshawytscha]
MHKDAVCVLLVGPVVGQAAVLYEGRPEVNLPQPTPGLPEGRPEVNLPQASSLPPLPTSGFQRGERPEVRPTPPPPTSGFQRGDLRSTYPFQRGDLNPYLRLPEGRPEVNLPPSLPPAPYLRLPEGSDLRLRGGDLRLPEGRPEVNLPPPPPTSGFQRDLRPERGDLTSGFQRGDLRSTYPAPYLRLPEGRPQVNLPPPPQASRGDHHILLSEGRPEVNFPGSSLPSFQRGDKLPPLANQSAHSDKVN